MKRIKVSTWPDKRKITIIKMKSTVWTKAFSIIRKRYPQYKDSTLTAQIIKD
jgi:hypothetical protein